MKLTRNIDIIKSVESKKKLKAGGVHARLARAVVVAADGRWRWLRLGF